MIVNMVETGWEVIYHRAHALLAAQLGGHWNRSDAPSRLYETLAAISHHDDLEKEFEGNHLTEVGAPMDFRLGSEGDEEATLKKLRWLISEARYRSRWVTLMISMHLVFLNKTNQGKSKAWDEFLTEQTRNQKEWCKALGISAEEADRAYQFMQWCDRLSLILAMRGVPVDNRALEITDRLDDQRYDIRQLEDGCVTVEPWCFEDDRFTVNVEARYLSQLQFESNEELIEALRDAPVKMLEWTFVKTANDQGTRFHDKKVATASAK